MTCYPADLPPSRPESPTLTQFPPLLLGQEMRRFYLSALCLTVSLNHVHLNCCICGRGADRAAAGADGLREAQTC